MTDPRIDELLDFWLGPLDAEGFSDAAHQQRWFQKSDDFDRELEERFGALHRAAAAGPTAIRTAPFFEKNDFTCERITNSAAPLEAL